jgi:hypothetical protein
MNALSAVPPRYQSVPSIQKLASSLDRARQRSRGEGSSKGKIGDMADLATIAGATALGAALCGAALARGVSEGAVGAGGGALAVIGIATGQPTLVHAANGVLAPLVAGWAGRTFAAR